MTRLWHGIVHALGEAGSMTWQVTWSLILGFTLSAVIQAVVRKSTIASLLPNARPRSIRLDAHLLLFWVLLYGRGFSAEAFGFAEEHLRRRCRGLHSVWSVREVRADIAAMRLEWVQSPNLTLHWTGAATVLLIRALVVARIGGARCMTSTMAIPRSGATSIGQSECSRGGA